MAELRHAAVVVDAHGFEARALLLKLAQDPARPDLARARVDRGPAGGAGPDRRPTGREDGGRRQALLGYNTNAGASIHMQLRSQDLAGFLPYPALIDTLLHELRTTRWGRTTSSSGTSAS